MLGVISDIHRVLTNLENLIDVRNDSVCSSNFSDVNLGGYFIPFFKKVTCRNLKAKEAEEAM